MIQVIALSGGKDSTALALRLQETEPDVSRIYFCTPTGDEMPGLVDHWNWLEWQLGQPIWHIGAHTLDGLIEKFNALPNGRQRWCTRMLKIEPCLAFLAKLASVTSEPLQLCVGLRADEEERAGIMSTDVPPRFPLREWGWGLSDVVTYNRQRGAKVPPRTDCARCYGQRLGEWWDLWRDHRDLWDSAEAQEAATGHTFRSAQRDTWPAGLADMRDLFERGARPKGARVQLDMFGDDAGACRVCRL